MLWDGQYEALNRLILGLGYGIGSALVQHGISGEGATKLQAELIKISMRRALLVQTTIGFIRFAVFLPKIGRRCGWNCRHNKTRGLSLGQRAELGV